MRVLGRALSWVLVVGLLAVVVGGIVAVRSGYGVYVVRSGSITTNQLSAVTAATSTPTAASFCGSGALLAMFSRS